MAFDRLEIPKDAILDGTNYTDWKLIVESVLKQHSLMDIVLKNDTTNPALAQSAKTFLLFSMNRDHRNKINHCSTAYDIWTSISSIYENNSRRAVTVLWKRLFSYRITSYHEVNKGISELQSIISSLESRDVKVDKSCLIGAIEFALPAEFDAWLVNWSMRESEPSLNELINAINNHIETIKSTEGRAMAASTTNPRPKQPSRPKPQSASSSKSCKYCKKTGHDVSECRKLKRKKEEEASQGKTIDFAMMAITSHPQQTQWLADSGASLHMTNNLSWISNYTPLVSPINIRLGDNRIIQAKGFGTIRLSRGSIRNVHYVPEIKSNLFSIASATDQGVDVTTNKHSMVFFKNGHEIARGNRIGKTYVLSFDIIPTDEVTCAAATIEEWHQRFGHISIDTIQKMKSSDAVHGLDLRSTQTPSCDSCAANKLVSAKHSPRTTPKATKPGTVLHIDTAGPIKTIGVGETRFILLAKDEFSNLRMGTCLRAKSQIPEEVQQMISRAEMETGNEMLKLVSDNGSEFLSQRLTNFLKHRGIVHQLSAAYTPQQNGFIEREIRTTVETARTLLNSFRLPQVLWPEAVRTAVYILNRTLSSNQSKTPYELWYNCKPNVKNLRVFGQHAMVLNNKTLSKFDEKGDKMIFVGYSSSFNTFRFFNPKAGRIVESCDVRFLNSYGPISTSDSDVEPLETPFSLPIELDAMTTYSHLTNKSFESEEDSLQQISTLESDHNGTLLANNRDQSFTSAHDILVADPNSPAKSDSNPQPAASDDTHPQPAASDDTNLQPASSDNTDSTQSQPTYANEEPIYANSEITLQQPTCSNSDPSRNLRPKKRNINYMDVIRGKVNHFAGSCIQQDTPEDPETLKQALDRPDSAMWIDAMRDEITSLEKCEVWELTDRPKCNIVSCRWVFKSKRSAETNEIVRYRARLVARGFTQERGVDFVETYAPVSDITSVRLLFAYAAQNRLTIKQFDVKCAFLYGNLDECVYMEQPPGIKPQPNKVYRLKKALYGLKQASRQWNSRITNFLSSLGLKQCSADSCIFIKQQPFTILVIYVDDGVIFSRSSEAIDEILTKLQSTFDVHLIDSNVFLGFQYRRNDDHSITIFQSRYIMNMLERYNMLEANPISTPEALTGKPDLTPSKPLACNVPYREAVGSLNYAARITRIDIAHAVSQVAQVSEPTEKDWTNLKRILRYLKGTPDLGITYSPNSPPDIVGYCDASFASDPIDFKSTTGFVFNFAHGPIYWTSKKQTLTTTSSTEAEFVSLCATTKEAVWLLDLSKELTISNGPIVINCDNTSTIRIANNEKAAKRTRHLGSQIMYPKDQINRNIITVNHVPSADQLADILTKPLGPQKFFPNRDKLMRNLTLATMILTICNIFAIDSYKFDTVDPIIYAPTNHHVEEQVTKYEIDFTYIDTCDCLTNDKDGFWQVLSGEHHEWNTLKERCNITYGEEWLPKIKEITQLHQQSSVNHRDKRSIYGDVLKAAGGYVIGVTTTNLMKSIAHFFGYRTAEEKLIENLRADLERERKRVQDFSESFNLTQHMTNEFANSYNNLAKAISSNRRQIQKLAQEEPTISWTLTYMQNKIVSSSSNLGIVLSKYHQGIVATRPLGDLLNIPALVSIDERDTVMDSIYLKGERTITFVFSVRERSSDTSIVRMVGIRHWTNLLHDPQLVEYGGPEFAVFNRTNKCIKAIEKPIDRFAIEWCDDANSVDPQLMIWKPSRDPIPKLSPVNTVKHTPKITYIYCFMDNFTIYDVTMPCPAEVFKIPSDVTFSVGKRLYKTKSRQMQANQDLKGYIDQIHPLQYTNKILNTNDIIEELRLSFNTSSPIPSPNPPGRQSTQTDYSPYIAYAIGLSSLIFSIIGILVTVLKRRSTDHTYETVQRDRPYELRSMPNRTPPLPPKDSALTGACRTE